MPSILGKLNIIIITIFLIKYIFKIPISAQAHLEESHKSGPSILKKEYCEIFYLCQSNELQSFTYEHKVKDKEKVKTQLKIHSELW